MVGIHLVGHGMKMAKQLSQPTYLYKLCSVEGMARGLPASLSPLEALPIPLPRFVASSSMDPPGKENREVVSHEDQILTVIGVFLRAWRGVTSLKSHLARIDQGGDITS